MLCRTSTPISGSSVSRGAPDFALSAVYTRRNRQLAISFARTRRSHFAINRGGQSVYCEPVARLFNALVVLGAGISASDCGGQIESDTNGIGGASGTGGSAGGTASTGGAPTGGFFGTGGNATGGAISSDATWLPDAATLAQWSCDGVLSTCGSFGDGPYVTLSAACPLDATRPSSPADCNSNEWFQCVQAQWLDGTPILVSCECTPYDAADAAPCVCIDPNGGYMDALCTDREKVCFCYTGILIR